MEAYDNNKPLIKQPWLRVILYIILYFLLLVTVTFIIKLVNGDSKNGNQVYIGVAIYAAVSLGFTSLFRKIMDRQSMMSLGFSTRKAGQHAMTGFLLGIFLLCTGSLILYMTDNLRWTDIDFNGQDLFLGLGLMIIVAVYEEVVFRGYILHNMMQSVNKWLALVITAVLFMLAHLGNPGITVVAAVNIFAAGLLLGLNYIYTRNLWFAIMLHFSWNFFQGPVLGYKVSGVDLKSVLQSNLTGNSLYTGGIFGFEGSVVALVLYIVAILLLVWAYERKYAPVN